jgi:hypothetical protein
MRCSYSSRYTKFCRNTLRNFGDEMSFKYVFSAKTLDAVRTIAFQPISQHRITLYIFLTCDFGTPVYPMRAIYPIWICTFSK